MCVCGCVFWLNEWPELSVLPRPLGICVSVSGMSQRNFWVHQPTFVKVPCTSIFFSCIWDWAPKKLWSVRKKLEIKILKKLQKFMLSSGNFEILDHRDLKKVPDSRFLNIIWKIIRIFFSKISLVWLTLGSVSYTHLDVYKRQQNAYMQVNV